MATNWEGIVCPKLSARSPPQCSPAQKGFPRRRKKQKKQVSVLKLQKKTPHKSRPGPASVRDERTLRQSLEETDRALHPERGPMDSVGLACQKTVLSSDLFPPGLFMQLEEGREGLKERFCNSEILWPPDQDSTYTAICSKSAPAREQRCWVLPVTISVLPAQDSPQLHVSQACVLPVLTAHPNLQHFLIPDWVHW